MLLTAAGDPPCTHIQHRLRFTSSFRLGNIIARALDYLLLELLPQPTPAATFSAPSVSVSLGCVAVTGGVLGLQVAEGNRSHLGHWQMTLWMSLWYSLWIPLPKTHPAFCFNLSLDCSGRSPGFGDCQAQRKIQTQKVFRELPQCI